MVENETSTEDLKQVRLYKLLMRIRPSKQKTNYAPLITIHLPERGCSVDHV
jgi:hypothetical protein